MCQSGSKSDLMFVGPNLGPNCLHLGYQQTTKVATSGERVMSETKFVAVDITYLSKMSLLTFNVNPLPIIYINKNLKWLSLKTKNA